MQVDVCIQQISEVEASFARHVLDVYLKIRYYFVSKIIDIDVSVLVQLRY